MKRVPRNRWLGRAVVFVLTGFAAGRPAVAATPTEVNDAIEKAKKYLYSQEKNGNWEAVADRKPGVIPPNDPSGQQYGGMTALATFALLSAGEDPSKNDQLKAAVKFLEKADMRGTYAIGLRSQIWNLLPEDDDVKAAKHRDLKMLLDGVRTGDPKVREEAGFFGYGAGMPNAEYGGEVHEQYDHSVSQFGVLGLWSLAQTGEEVPNDTWRLFDTAWRGHQHSDGAWSYLKETQADPRPGNGQGGELLSMTAAGVATLFITQDYVTTVSKCSGNIKDKNIEDGMKWIGANFKALDQKEWPRTWKFYTMFGICRIGLASGYKMIGTTDWFQWGADKLIASQDAGGGWGGGQMMGFGGNSEPVDSGIYNSGFALLFLSRGSGPVIFNKLQYSIVTGKKSSEANWNERPRDIANLTRTMGKWTEIPNMNWQIVNLNERPQDLLDAPLLYMAGNQNLKLSPGDLQKLKDYIDQGGIIVANADCQTTAFSESFRKMGEAMYPGERFDSLPADHPIYRGEAWQAKKWIPAPKLEALTNGARVRMILLPAGDPSKLWHTNSFQAIKADVYGQLMMNIYLYATDLKSAHSKGETYVVSKDPAQTATKTIKVARLQYAGNWNPEPKGWERLGAILHNTKQTDLDVQTVELGKGQLTSDYKLADITGTAAVKLTDGQVDELAKYVAGGGTLLIDAAGGKSAFTSSMNAVLAKIAPGAGAELPTLPLSSPVYSAGGDPLKEVNYRRYAKSLLGALHTPQLRGLVKDGRVPVVVSNEDIAVGLVGQQVDGIIGYDPASAVAVAEQVVMYAGK